MKPVRRLGRASADIDGVTAYYAAAVSPQTAERFVEELTRAMEHIGHHPGTGSTRYAGFAGVDGLRFWAPRRFPYAVFYVERPHAIHVLRVLHQASDIPQHLQPQ